jgi:hypothetical protein
MKADDQNMNQPDLAVRLDEDASCDLCGRFGAFHFGERTLCPECYNGCGSCCPEFGKDDLWAEVLSNSTGQPKQE